MSRVKYPDKKVIDIEINHILDKSGLFDSELQNESNYVSATPIRNKSTILHSAMSLAAAAVVLVVIAVGSGASRSIGTNSIFKPKASLEAEDDSSVVSSTDVNSMIRVDMKSAEDSLYSSSETNSIKYEYTIPDVYLQGNQVDKISEFYQTYMKELEQDALKEYNKIVQSTEYDETVSQPVESVYNCSISNGLSSTNQNVVSFLESYTYTTKTLSRNKIEKSLYGHNFDVTTGEEIGLQDIFTDYADGVTEIATYLDPLLKDAYNNNDSAVLTVRKAYASDFIKDGCWYFSEDGIMICSNGIYWKNSEYGEKEYSNVSGATFLIPYSALPSLKTEYKN